MSTASPERPARSFASRLAVAILPAGALLFALLFSVGNVNTLHARGKTLETEREAFLRDRAAALEEATAGIAEAVSAAAALAFADAPERPSYPDAFAFLRAIPAAEAVALLAMPESGTNGVLAWRDPPHFRRRPLSGSECEEDAFRLAALSRGAVWTRAPRFASANEENLVVSARAATQDGQVPGVAAASVPATALTDLLTRDSPFWAQWLLLTRDGIVLHAPAAAWAEGENLFLLAEETSDPAVKELAEAMTAGGNGKWRLRLAGGSGPHRVLRYRPIGTTGLSVALVTPEMEGYWNPFIWPRATVVIFLASLAALFAIVFALTKSLTSPFAELSGIASALARGDAADAAARAEALGKGEGRRLGIREYAAMADALGEAARRGMEDEKGKTAKRERMLRQTDALTAEAAALREALASRAASARFLASAGDEGARRIGELAGEIATAAGTAMSHATLLAAGGARLAQATSNAEDLRLGAEGLLALLGDVAEKAEDLAGATEGIHAMATNVDLLAVNAAMEGERAGDAGKGFGAIAREIRNLSTHTTETAGTIATGAAELVKATAGAKEELRLFLDRLSNRIDEVRSVEQRLASRIDGAKATAETYRGTAEELQRTAGKGKSLSEEGGKILRTSEALGESLERIEAAATALRREAE
jgi:methyl-accepting chemotaxis protein